MGSAGTTLTQTARLLQIDTPLGPDKFAVRSVFGREAISEMFEVSIDLASEDFQVKPASLIAKPVTLKIRCGETDERYINGIVNRVTLVPTQPDKLARYRLRVVPVLWFLTRTTNCAIFQDKTTPEIIEAILQKYQIVNYKLRLRATYQKRDYCVQYRETAFDFISRLMEEEGISYYFEHTDTLHRLILADCQASYSPCVLHDEISWQAPSGGFEPKQEPGSITDWARTMDVRPKTWTQGDFQFEKPKFHLLDSEPSVSETPGPDLERYDYPGRFGSMDEGQHLTRIRMEEEEAAIDTVSGESNCRGLVPGYTFRLRQIYQSDQTGTFLITSLDYEAEQGSLYGGDESTGGNYQNRFTAIPAKTAFRPPRVTSRPFVHGPQTAFVTGPAGEEMYVDKYGRVKVQFHWDRQGQYNETSSCWVRVSQSVAGLGWGAMQLPRVGHEVIVEFLEGDPDRPLITGRLYNADHMPPYKLPDEQSKMTLKTLSYPGGGGFNEFRLEDKKGSEQVFLHGEKDLDVRIKNDRREWIGQDRHLITQRDKLEQIGRDKHETIQRDVVQQISRDHHLTISGKEAISITGSHSVAVTGDVIEQFSGNQSTQITGSCYIKGMNVVIEATTGLTINVGSNFLTINAAGIQMQGTMVMVNGAGMAIPGMPGNLVSPISPAAPAVADDATTGQQGSDPTGGSSGAAGQTGAASGSSASSSNNPSNAPWHNPDSPANKDKTSWIEIELTDQDNKPVPGEPYRVTLPDGQTLAEGTLDDKGKARVEALDPGTCKVTFPQRDKRSWKPK